MHFIPLLRLGCNDKVQRAGIDSCEMGEFAYDYVGQERELQQACVDDGAVGVGMEPMHQNHEVQDQGNNSTAGGGQSHVEPHSMQTIPGSSEGGHD